MSHTRAEPSLRFIEAAELADNPFRSRGAEAANPSAGHAVLDALQTSKQQAAVVGSEVVAFAEGVPGPLRELLVNSTLLAQLVATKQVPDRSRLFDWYDAYYGALAQVGWAVQQRNFSIYVESGQNFDAHKAIIAVLASVLAPGATALAMITGTLNALQSMGENSPWISLFNRQSVSASSSSFQISAVEKGADGEPFVTMAAFALEAKTKIVQVLVFRSRSSDATLRHCSSQISMDPSVAEQVREPLRQKLVNHALDYVKSLPDF